MLVALYLVLKLVKPLIFKVSNTLSLVGKPELRKIQYKYHAMVDLIEYLLR
jgi:hypothetical protein